MIRHLRNDWRDTVGIIITIRNGSRFEDAKTEGFTHLAEHLMFSGTKTHSRYKLRDIHDRVFNELEATTSRENVNVFCYVDACDVERALVTLQDMIFNWTCRKTEFPDEKKDLIQEMKSFLKSEEHDTRRSMDRLLSSGDHEIMGTISSMRKLSYRDLPKVKRYWNAFLKVSPIDILFIGGRVTPRHRATARRLFGTAAMDRSRRRAWKLKSAAFKENRNDALLEIQCNIRHPYFLLLHGIYDDRWQATEQGTLFDWAQFNDRTVFFVSHPRKQSARTLLLRPVSTLEFQRAKRELTVRLRRAVDGINPITSLLLFQGFQFRSYGDLPSERPSDILRMYERLTFKRFTAFLKPIFEEIR